MNEYLKTADSRCKQRGILMLSKLIATGILENFRGFKRKYVKRCYFLAVFLAAGFFAAGFAAGFFSALASFLATFLTSFFTSFLASFLAIFLASFLVTFLLLECFTTVFVERFFLTVL
jgi:hypothetical protein